MNLHDWELAHILAENRERSRLGGLYAPPGPLPLALALHDIAVALEPDYPEFVIDGPATYPESRGIFLSMSSSSTFARMIYLRDDRAGLPAQVAADHPRLEAFRAEVFRILRALGFQPTRDRADCPVAVTGHVSRAIPAHRRLAIRAAIAPYRVPQEDRTTCPA